MARSSSGGRVMSRSSTWRTSTPQCPVDAAITVRSSLLTSSRCARRLSSSWRPMIDRRLVMAMRWLAKRKLSTPSTAWTGSTTWKYTTASTWIVTLSLVMTACGGMSTTSTRSVTFTSRSTMGNRKITPGPLASGRTWPSRKNTDRSYSVTTLIAEERKMKARTRTTSTATMMPTSRPRRGQDRPHE